MRIAILGTGNIGKTLAHRLAKADHEIKVANSRGPQTIDNDVLLYGARAVDAKEAIRDVDVIILSIPFAKLPKIKDLLSNVPQGVVVIDTSNYYPVRDHTITAVDNGQVESLWVTEQLGRPVAKAWNAIGAQAFAQCGQPRGSDGRIAIPVAADRDHDLQVTIQLVDETGLDAFAAGTLADSWRQQPGSPAYCTNLTMEQISTALASAEKERLPKRRDFVSAIAAERFTLEKISNSDADFLLRLSRLVYM